MGDGGWVAVEDDGTAPGYAAATRCLWFLVSLARGCGAPLWRLASGNPCILPKKHPSVASPLFCLYPNRSGLACSFLVGRCVCTAFWRFCAASSSSSMLPRALVKPSRGRVPRPRCPCDRLLGAEHRS